MEFLVWHYTQGLNLYINRWIFYFKWISHYFSLPTLITSLFAPWKRLVEEDKSPGFDIARFFETFTFNLISRGIGAMVRFILFWAGLFILLLSLFGGAFGMVLWLVLPILGIPHYLNFKKTPGQFMANLLLKIKKSKRTPTEVITESEAGKFLLDHINVEVNDFNQNTNITDHFFINLKVDFFGQLIEKLAKEKAWTQEYLRKKELSKNDLILTASWWDKERLLATSSSDTGFFGRPGIGLELLFGYTPNLNQSSVDLSLEQEWSHHLIGREQVVSQIERALTGGKSVVVVGTPGVGKRTVIYEFARRAAQGKLGQKMAYRRVLEFDYNFLLSETSDLNQKKSKLGAILAEASSAGNIILVIRDIHRLTNSEVEGYDFTDIFEEYLEDKELKIMAVATPADYERFIAPNLRLRKFLNKIEVAPPTKEEAMEILIQAAIDWEAKRPITVTIQALRKILDESDKYITETPFPEKALELLDAVVMFKEQSGGRVIDVDDTNTVLAEKTGISFSHLTGEEKKQLNKLEEIIHQRLVNQETAVSLIAKSLRGRLIGVKNENRPVGSFLFLGPTGVGKTETAKVLAKVYYGSKDNIIRFDMAEYAGSEGLERLIGSVSKNQPGMLTTAIKNKPASLLLLDEIEKASSEINNLFLSLLDEGSITDAFGRKVNCRHLFVIATSNAGAEYIRQLVSRGTSGSDLQTKVVNYVLENGLFTPEFLNRFDGVVVYEPLKHEDLVKIAHLLLKEMADNLKKKNIAVVIADETAVKIAEEGYDPAFGARPMGRIIDLVLGDVLGKAILAEEILPEDRIKIIPAEGKQRYNWVKIK